MTRSLDQRRLSIWSLVRTEDSVNVLHSFTRRSVIVTPRGFHKTWLHDPAPFRDELGGDSDRGEQFFEGDRFVGCVGESHVTSAEH